MFDKTTASDKKYLLGVIGDARSLASFWQMAKDRVDEDLLGSMGVLAAALPEADVPPKKLDMGIGIPVYAGFREMLYMHPEINLVIETTGDPKLLKTIRKTLPPTVTLVERAAASFFINLLTSNKACTACKIDLMQTQSLLTTVLDQLKEDILFLDAEGVILNANQTLCNKLNMEKRQLIGHHFSDFFTNVGPTEDKDGVKHKCSFTHAMNTGQPAEAVASEIEEDGRVRYYRVYMYPIFNGRELNRMVAMRRDITWRTELEQRLQQTRKLASIGELSTYIAHEIRNPLMAISGFANSLLRGASQDKASQEKLQIIMEESRRLDAILKEIINFTRPVDSAPSPIDVNLIVKEALEVMDMARVHPDIRLHLTLTDKLPRVAADPDMLKQCIINIATNGIEAMKQGGELRVSTVMSKEHVILSVADDGHGIPAEIRDDIFSPFFSTRGKGAGLGLAMTRKIMDDIGGDVELVSNEGKGTTISLLLPPVLAVAQTPETA